MVLFGPEHGAIIKTSETHQEDVGTDNLGNAECVRYQNGCIWSSSASNAYIEIRLDQPTIVKSIAWEIAGGHNSLYGRKGGVSFDFKRDPDDWLWMSITHLVPADTGSLLVEDHKPELGPITDIRYQCHGFDWCKVKFFNAYG